MGSRHLLLNDNGIQPQSVFLRHDIFSGSAEFWSSALIKTVHAYLLGNPNVRCLNRHSLLWDNNKVYNLLLAQQLNMRVPQTTILAGLPTVIKQRFVDQDVIAKPLAGGDFAVQVPNLNDAALTYASSFVQERLPGKNFRVFVIDQEVFGFDVQSEALDYRVDTDTCVVPLTPPDAIAAQAAEIARICGFDYCALDFRQDAAGEWVFLEINSFPMFTAFDDAAENRLVEAQLAFLTGKAF